MLCCGREKDLSRSKEKKDGKNGVNKKKGIQSDIYSGENKQP